MTQVVLSTEQIRQISEADEPVVFVDAAGHCVAYVATGFTPAEIELAEQRLGSDGPWHSTADVLEHLRALESRT